MFEKCQTPRRRIFFRCAALKILGIHKVFPRIFALLNEKISRRRAFCHLSNKAQALYVVVPKPKEINLYDLPKSPPPVDSRAGNR